MSDRSGARLLAQVLANIDRLPKSRARDEAALAAWKAGHSFDFSEGDVEDGLRGGALRRLGLAKQAGTKKEPRTVLRSMLTGGWPEAKRPEPKPVVAQVQCSHEELVAKVCAWCDEPMDDHTDDQLATCKRFIDAPDQTAAKTSAGVYTPKTISAPVATMAERVGQTLCASCHRPWNQHQTSEVDVCLTSIRRMS